MIGELQVVENENSSKKILHDALSEISKSQPSWDARRDAIKYTDHDAVWHRGMLTGWLLLAAMRPDGVIASSVEQEGSWVSGKRETGIFWAEKTLETHPIETQIRWMLPRFETRLQEKDKSSQVDFYSIFGTSDYREIARKYPNIFLPFVAGFKGLNDRVLVENGGDLVRVGSEQGPCLQTKLRNLTPKTLDIIQSLLNIDVVKLHGRLIQSR